MILALAGGVGGAKLADGLARLLAPEDLVVAVNTGDDFVHLGLHVSPDIDTVVYTLAGRANPVTGWGLAGETWAFLDALAALGGETWFKLGDRDLATHVERTRLLAAGMTLSEITARFATRYGIRHPVVPMSDAPVRTIVRTDAGDLAFQDYFVRRQCAPVVRELIYQGGDAAALSPALAAALQHQDLEAVIICPSNPHLSIGPFLAMPACRRHLAARRVPVIAVSPIIGGRAVKGPAAKILAELGLAPSPLAIATYYHGLVDALLIDEGDSALAADIRALGIEPVVRDIMMHDAAGRGRLAADCLAIARRG